MASVFPPAPPEVPQPATCDGCGEPIEGEPAGFGVYLWTRGTERREEREPLCAPCATAIGCAISAQVEEEEEDG